MSQCSYSFYMALSFISYLYYCFLPFISDTMHDEHVCTIWLTTVPGFRGSKMAGIGI